MWDPKELPLSLHPADDVASVRLPVTTAAAETSVAAAKSALDAAEGCYRAGQLSFVEADATRDAFVRIESTRRRLGLQRALALARSRIWSEQRLGSGAR